MIKSEALVRSVRPSRHSSDRRQPIGFSGTADHTSERVMSGKNATTAAAASIRRQTSVGGQGTNGSGGSSVGGNGGGVAGVNSSASSLARSSVGPVGSAFGSGSGRRTTTVSSASISEPRPLRRTPGGEDDDEISNYMAHPPDHMISTVEQPAPIWRDRRANTSSEMHSVAGTEQQSIVDKISRRAVKGLHDMVKQQQDEAAAREQMQQNLHSSSGGGLTNSGLSSSLILPSQQLSVPSDVLSDLSDQTSREPRQDDQELDFLARNVSGVAISSRRLDEIESKNVLKILQSSENLSQSELGDLIAILNDRYHSHTDGRSVSEAVPSQAPGLSGKERSRSLGTPTPPIVRVVQSSTASKPGHASQSPSTVSGASKQKSSAATGGEVRRSNSGPLKAPTNRLVVSSSLEAPSASSSPNSHIASKRSNVLDIDDDVDEEMAFLLLPHDSTERGGHSSNTTTPHRALATPSPKHKRATNTPTKTPPIRSGAVPAIASYLGRDSFDADTNVVGTTILSSTPGKNGGSKYRESQSPPNIWRKTADAPVGIALPVGVRKGAARRDSSSVSSLSTSVDCSLSEPSTSRKHKMASGHGNTSPSHVRGQSTARLSELHMSARSAFDDRSVNSMSSSSASYSHHQ